MSDNINMVDALHKTIYNQDQQIAELKAENERLKDEICKYEITLMDKNSQLKEKDELIASQSKYITEFDEKSKSDSNKDELKDNTKQVCEKIREKLSLHCDYKDNIGWYMPENKFNLILDQIENEKKDSN